MWGPAFDANDIQLLSLVLPFGFPPGAPWRLAYVRRGRDTVIRHATPPYRSPRVFHQLEDGSCSGHASPCRPCLAVIVMQCVASGYVRCRRGPRGWRQGGKARPRGNIVSYRATRPTQLASAPDKEGLGDKADTTGRPFKGARHTRRRSSQRGSPACCRVSSGNGTRHAAGPRPQPRSQTQSVKTCLPHHAFHVIHHRMTELILEKLIAERNEAPC